jgi:hypothetical protein
MSGCMEGWSVGTERSGGQSEKQIQAEVLEAIGGRTDCRLWRQNPGDLLSPDGMRHVKGAPTGIADLGGVLRIDTPHGPRGISIQIEVKAERGRQRPEQKVFQSVIERFGGVYLLVRSKDDAIRQVEAAVVRLRRGR